MRSLLIAVAAVAAWASAAPASACSCGEVRGPVVAHGTTPHGVSWRIRAERDGRVVNVDFSLAPPGYPDAGFGMGVPLPVRDAFVFNAVSGDDLDPFGDADLSGIAARRVALLVVRMNKGPALRIRPALAPWRLRKRYPWLHDLRFFDAFFAEGLDAVEVVALDANGRVLTRRRSHGGLSAL